MLLLRRRARNRPQKHRERGEESAFERYDLSRPYNKNQSDAPIKDSKGKSATRIQDRSLESEALIARQDRESEAKIESENRAAAAKLAQQKLHDKMITKRKDESLKANNE